MRGTRILGPVLVAGAIALSASAEVYRWTDAKGVVHYTSDLKQVPASQRDLARAAVHSGKGSLQRVGTGKPPAPPAGSTSPSGGPRMAGPPAAHAGEEEYEGWNEARWREEGERLRRTVETYARPSEDCERLVATTGDGGDASREEEHEAAMCRQTYKEYETARQRVVEFEERAHRAGVPPGWIRE